MKIDHLIKVLALVQTSDKNPVPSSESESSEQTQLNAMVNSPVLRKIPVDDEELTMVSTLKRRQSDQEVEISDQLLWLSLTDRFRLRAYWTRRSSTKQTNMLQRPSHPSQVQRMRLVRDVCDQERHQRNQRGQRKRIQISISNQIQWIFLWTNRIWREKDF